MNGARDFICMTHTRKRSYYLHCNLTSRHTVAHLHLSEADSRQDILRLTASGDFEMSGGIVERAF